MSATSIIERFQNVMFPAAAPYHGDAPLVVDHAKDQYIWDVDGTRYLDFFGGVLTVSVGHCNEEVTQRTLEQLQKVQHTSTIYINPIMVEVAEKVVALTPPGLQKCYFTNSGTEANETAIMAARMYTGNPIIITLRHAYSGRTMTAMSLTAHGNWRLGGVVDPYVRHVRNPYTYRAPVDLTPEQVVDLCVQDLEETLATTTNGRIAAFMAEPIQGVGGFIVPPEDYFKRVMPIVKEAGGVFIADEVQTGWGRTGGKWFGIEQFGVEPDIMTFAKGMANGSPIGCTITTAEIAEAVQGATFATFGGNPVTMATALATIEYIEAHNLVENAAVQGAKLREKLEEFQAEFPFIGEVRGMGLMQALEIVEPGSKTPDKHRATALMDSAKSHGLLLGKGGLYGNVIRVAPHLNVADADMEAAFELIGAALVDVS
ncbi:aspartate aminotransferase family protein [Phototrophicus methaneseepsis]|uniref:alanine--glyoxylate transaminase n=1 Tax=Phototrophicus methaneseepsis TaxID=2710758 RepID=A0A7S8EBD5_9CHLR|nr:aspartate aminotransferase family protein [Phototrophicus methaneseepsis]QPC83826.1 aspartate aminotransferase family protein [Phototrophicus methaneseepsis]